MSRAVHVRFFRFVFCTAFRGLADLVVFFAAVRRVVFARFVLFTFTLPPSRSVVRLGKLCSALRRTRARARRPRRPAHAPAGCDGLRARPASARASSRGEAPYELAPLHCDGTAPHTRRAGRADEAAP